MSKKKEDLIYNNSQDRATKLLRGLKKQEKRDKKVSIFAHDKHNTELIISPEKFKELNGNYYDIFYNCAGPAVAEAWKEHNAKSKEE